jgi:hypothetical protein
MTYKEYLLDDYINMYQPTKGGEKWNQAQH